MEETTFENAQVGDRVYSCAHYCEEGKTTNGIITDIDLNNTYPIVVNFGKLRAIFTIKGMYHHDFPAGQVLFWSKPEFVVPVRPKRKKIIEGYVGVSVQEPSIVGIVASLTNLYETPEQVRYIMNVGKVVFIKIEIEE